MVNIIRMPIRGGRLAMVLLHNSNIKKKRKTLLPQVHNLMHKALLDKVGILMFGAQILEQPVSKS